MGIGVVGDQGLLQGNVDVLAFPAGQVAVVKGGQNGGSSVLGARKWD